MKKMWLVAAITAMVAGCGTTNRTSYLQDIVVPDRADFGDLVIPAPPPPPTTRKLEIVNPDPVKVGVVGGEQTIQDVVMGTWTFVTPPTVTRVEKKTGTTSEFTLYNGRPEPTDLPFLVISVNRETRSLAESDPAMYAAQNTRTYALNGNAAKEWTGKLKNGAAFCELVITKLGTAPGQSDVCHAMAIARNEEERKLAEGILGSITWKAAE